MTCPDCKIVSTASYGPGSTFHPVIQFCEACTKAHEIKAERDALRAALERIIECYERGRKRDTGTGHSHYVLGNADTETR
jgi:hypothetical protein